MNSANLVGILLVLTGLVAGIETEVVTISETRPLSGGISLNGSLLVEC